MINGIFDPITLPPGRDGAFLNLGQGLGLASYMVVIGYEFLLFVYFFLVKFKDTRKMYWLYFSLFFLFTCLSRAVLIFYDFLMAYFIDLVRADPLYPLQIYRIANFIDWLAIATMIGVLTTLIFTKEDKLSRILRICLPIAGVIVGSLFLILSDESLINVNYYIYMDPYSYGYAVTVPISEIPSPVNGLGLGSFVLNLLVTPLVSFGLPIIFLYLAYKSVGLIRKSSAMNGFGFLLFWLGRFSTYFFTLTLKPNGDPWSGLTQAAWPALIMIFGLLFLAMANLILQQK